MQWVKASERWPDVNDKFSVSANGRIVIRWADGDVFHTADVHVANKDLLGPRTEWLEGAFVTERNEVVAVIVPKTYSPSLWWYMLVAGASGGILARMVLDALKGLTGWELP
jgi:hypothetical protein